MGSAGGESMGFALAVAYAMALVGQASEAGVYALLIPSMNPSRLGVYMAVTAAMLLVGTLVAWGAPSTLVRGFSSGSMTLRGVQRAYVASRAPAGLAAATVAGLVLVATLPGQATFELVIPLGIAQVARLLEILWNSWLHGMYFQGLANVVVASSGIAKLAYVAILLHVVGSRSIVAVAWGVAAAAVASAATQLLAARRLSRDEALESRTPVTWRGLFRRGTGFATQDVAASVQGRLDWMLVAWFTTPVGLASYGVANKLFELVGAGVGVGLGTLFPYLCRQKDQRTSARLDAFFRAVLFLFGAAALAVNALIWPALAPHLPETYRHVQSVLPFFLAAHAIGMYPAVLFFLVAAAERDRDLGLAAVFVTVLQTAANLILIPIFGLKGGAAGMVVSTGSSAAIFTVIALRRRLLPPDRLARYAVGALGTAAAIGVSAIHMQPAYAPKLLALGTLVLASAILIGTSPRTWRLSTNA